MNEPYCENTSRIGKSETALLWSISRSWNAVEKFDQHFYTGSRYSADIAWNKLKMNLKHLCAEGFVSLQNRDKIATFNHNGSEIRIIFINLQITKQAKHSRKHGAKR